LARSNPLPQAGSESGVWVKDLLTGQLVTVATADPDVASVTAPGLSDDGRHVVFASITDDLVADDDNSTKDIFRMDLVTGELVRVSVDANGNDFALVSDHPAVSDDGRFVSFPGHDITAQQVFVKDLLTGVLHSTTGDDASNSIVLAAWVSRSDDIVAGDENGLQDIFFSPTGFSPSSRSVATASSIKGPMAKGAASFVGESVGPVSSAQGPIPVSGIRRDRGRGRPARSSKPTGSRPASTAAAPAQHPCQSRLRQRPVNAGRLARWQAMADITGTQGDDVLSGTTANDVIGGLAGSDAIFGGNGDDIIVPGVRDDIAKYSSSPASETVDLKAGTAEDGYGSTDVLYNITGIGESNFDDTLFGDGYDDFLIGGGGQDQLDGRNGGDRLLGGRGADEIAL
jgi:Ca2+-binding RTX toxin-like protein